VETGAPLEFIEDRHICHNGDCYAGGHMAASFLSLASQSALRWDWAHGEVESVSVVCPMRGAQSIAAAQDVVAWNAMAGGGWTWEGKPGASCRRQRQEEQVGTMLTGPLDATCE